MLNRRRFAACAICSAMGLVAAGVDTEAQAAAGFKLTILHRTEFPGDTYVMLLARSEIAPGFLIARHTHPGVESSYLLEGGGTLSVKGRPDRELKAGEGFQVPPETPHSLQNGNARTIVVITYVVDKNKPLASPAPE